MSGASRDTKALRAEALKSESGRHHRIGTRIGFGFAVVLALHVTIAVMGHQGLNNAAADAEIYDVMQQQAVQFVENEAAVLQLQRDVLLFTFTGHRGVPERVFSTRERLVVALSSAREQSSQVQVEILDAMMRVLDDYEEHFRAVMVDRGLRRKLQEESFAPQGAAYLEMLSAVLEESTAAGEAQAILSTRESLEALLRAQAAASDYFRDPSGAEVRRFERQIKLLESSLHQLLSLPLAKSQRKQVAAMQSSLSDYAAVLSKIVQATRSYLHLVNVVLAGEALEFQTLSAEFKKQGMANIAAHRQSMRSEQERFEFWSNIVSFLTIGLGLAFGALIGRSVTVPLIAMTHTLTELSKGVSATIPGRDRKDEVGEMARAAEIFKQRNVQTEELLESSRELTQRHEETNERLEMTVEKLRERNVELDSFAYIASHDLKAPLRAISHLVTWIEDDNAEVLGEESKQHLVTLRARVQRLELLLNGLLRYSRVGREQHEVESIDVRSLVESVVGLNDVEGHFAVSIEGRGVTVNSFKPLMEQVVMNLVSNAVKHHDQPRGRIDIEIEQTATGARIAVTDDGPGIPQQFRDRVFKIFQTLKPRDEKESSGIGLSIVEKTVNALGGGVSIESTGERGARFVVEWPNAELLASTLADTSAERRSSQQQPSEIEASVSSAPFTEA